MTVFASVLMVPIMLIAWLGIALGQGYVVRDHAQTTADLAALAGATASCARAEQVVAANAAESLSPRVELVSCVIDGADARVVVEAQLPDVARRLLDWLDVSSGSVLAKARAGDVE